MGGLLVVVESGRNASQMLKLRQPGNLDRSAPRAGGGGTMAAMDALIERLRVRFLRGQISPRQYATTLAVLQARRLVVVPNEEQTEGCGYSHQSYRDRHHRGPVTASRPGTWAPDRPA